MSHRGAYAPPPRATNDFDMTSIPSQRGGMSSGDTLPLYSSVGPNMQTEQQSYKKYKKTTTKSKGYPWWLYFLGFLALLALLAMVAAILAYAIMIWNELNATVVEEVLPCCLTENCVDTPWCDGDIIIAGCGSAGSLLASLLSDPANTKKFSVVCLEQGYYHNHDDLVKYAVLGGFPEFVITSTVATYTHTTVANLDPSTPGWSIPVSLGSMVGGSGNHDYVENIHPSPAFGAAMGSTFGTSWNYAGLQAQAAVYEDYVGPVSPCVRGTTGLIAATQVVFELITTVTGQFFAAFVANSPVDAAATVPVDYNCNTETWYDTASQFFVDYINATTMLRSNSGINYLGDDIMTPTGYGMNGRKLRVIMGATVNKFVMDSSNRAEYVLATVNGITRRFYANKQIILAAGSVTSPNIVERSGIGGATLLNSLGIPVVADVPEVGENLQVHLCTTIVLATNDSTAPPPSPLILNGLAGMSVLPEYGGLRSIQLLSAPGIVPIVISRGFINDIDLEAYPDYGFITFVTALVAPESRGNIHITGKEPSRQANFNTNAYSDTTGRDMRALVEALKIQYAAILDLRTNNPGNAYELLVPNESVFLAANDTIIEDFITSNTFDLSHYSSTLSMGPVLDNNLSLKAVTGVSVGDTAAWDKITNGFPRTQALITASHLSQHLLATLTYP